MEGHRSPQLVARILRMAEATARQLYPGVRLLGDGRVAKKRQDGVVKGRSGYLDLAALGSLAVFFQCYIK